MDHWQRIRTAIAGERTDRTPVSLWRHFPEFDQDPRTLAARMVDWQRKWDFDLVKFMPSGTYGVEDWGAVSAYRGAMNGAREIVEPGIRNVEDWALESLDVRKGVYGMQNEALEIAAQQLDGSVPILQTIFNPLTTARKLAGERLLSDLRRYPEVLEKALQTITDVTIRFALDAIECGAHGVFLATQLASHRLLSDAEYARFGRPYDLQVLRAVTGSGRINMLHAHGLDLMLDMLADYPVEMLNWHDRLTDPGLGAAAEKFPGLVAGGLNEGSTLVSSSTDGTRDEVLDALQQTGGRRVMIAPGCVLRVDTRDEHIKTVIRTVDSWKSIR
jgi:uroporphyrinogen decarboxylase